MTGIPQAVDTVQLSKVVPSNRHFISLRVIHNVTVYYLILHIVFKTILVYLGAYTESTVLMGHIINTL